MIFKPIDADDSSRYVKFVGIGKSHKDLVWWFFTSRFELFIGITVHDQRDIWLTTQRCLFAYVYRIGGNRKLSDPATRKVFLQRDEFIKLQNALEHLPNAQFHWWGNVIQEFAP